MSDQQKEQALNFGALNYTVDMICTIWDCHPCDLNDEFWKLYHQGEAMAQYVMDLKVFEMAKSGDLKAMQVWKNGRAMRQKK